MPGTKATARALAKGLKLKTGSPHVIQVVQASLRVRLVGLFFDLDKCFLLPSAIPGIRVLKQRYDEHPGSHLLIIGHTDTSGRDAYNLALSLERADALAAYLTDKADAWDAFFGDGKPEEKRWGTREIQLMLSVLPEGGPPFFAGDPSGREDAATTRAVKDFQASKGLEMDGIAGPETRKALIEAYMGLDGTTLPSGIGITTHGCGENFPVAETGDGVRDPDNRRAEILFFDGAITPPPPGKTSKKGSTEYPRWLKQVAETTDVTTGKVTADALRLRVIGDPTQVLDRTDRFRLFDGAGFEQTLSIAGDAVETEQTVDLVYKDVPVGGIYSLQVLRDDGDAYFLFENEPFAAIPKSEDAPEEDTDPLEPEPGT
jgi:outer membrane protein OmpA-like peptidoglycan-associated protein